MNPSSTESALLSSRKTLTVTFSSSGYAKFAHGCIEINEK